MKIGYWSNREPLRVIMAFLTLVVLVGCGGLGSYQGRPVRAGALSPLLPSENAAHYESRDIIVDYSYQQKDGVIAFDGVVNFTEMIQSNFTLLRYFYLGIIFADENGRVLGMHGLTSSGPWSIDTSFEFKTSVVAPAGARFYAFTYRGEAISGNTSSGGGGSTYFWDYPIK